jgi:hypothetical protein
VSDRRDGPDFVGGLPGTNDTVDKYYADDIRARNGCNLDAQYVPFHQHEARVDQLKAENAKLREDLKFQGAITDALLPYQEEAVTLREVLRRYIGAYPTATLAPYHQHAYRIDLEDRARALLEGK